MSFCSLTNSYLVVVHIRANLRNLKIYLSMFIKTFANTPDTDYDYDVVYVTIGNPAFCLALYLTSIHFRDKLKFVLVMWVSKKSSVDQSELEK